MDDALPDDGGAVLWAEIEATKVDEDANRRGVDIAACSHKLTSQTKRSSQESLAQRQIIAKRKQKPRVLPMNVKRLYEK